VLNARCSVSITTLEALLVLFNATRLRMLARLEIENPPVRVNPIFDRGHTYWRLIVHQ
jgi:hypothetical protein